MTRKRAITAREQSIDCVEPYINPTGDESKKIALLDLTRLYDADPWRFYHNGVHLKEMTDFLLENIDLVNDPEIVFGAALGHDSVYEPWLYRGGLNEKLSENRTETILSPHYDARKIGKMCMYIAATAKHPTNTTDSDLALFLDADMRILAAEPERFEEYEDGIRSEFTYKGTFSSAQFKKGRYQFLSGMKDQRIFRTELAQDLYEERAHQNIAMMALKYGQES